ncbi:MAG: hypothetical protein LIV11_04155 [Bacillota bacterium]|nr:hypothetical protein [Bacillota bacterium]
MGETNRELAVGYRKIRDYKSRTNTVYLAEPVATPGTLCVVKEFGDYREGELERLRYQAFPSGGYKVQTDLSGRIVTADLRVPKVIESTPMRLVLEYVSGKNLAKILRRQEALYNVSGLRDGWEEPWILLTEWVQKFYRKMHFVLDDLDLHNFIYIDCGDEPIMCRIDLEGGMVESRAEAIGTLLAEIEFYEQKRTPLCRKIQNLIVELSLEFLNGKSPEDARKAALSRLEAERDRSEVDDSLRGDNRTERAERAERNDSAVERKSGRFVFDAQSSDGASSSVWKRFFRKDRKKQKSTAG